MSIKKTTIPEILDSLSCSIDQDGLFVLSLYFASLIVGSAAVSVLPPNQIQSLPLKESVIQEPLNLSSREKPRSPLHKANGRIPGTVNLV